MASSNECRCSHPVESTAAVCPRCGGALPKVEVVWAEDVITAPPQAPRIDPPRHAETMAVQLYDRVAGGTRTRRRPRTKPAWRLLLVGVTLFATAGVMFTYNLDAALVHVVSIGLAVAGFVTILKVLMGYGR